MPSKYSKHKSYLLAYAMNYEQNDKFWFSFFTHLSSFLNQKSKYILN